MQAFQFNATQFDPSFGMSTLPEDWYNLVITKGEMKPTKDGTGMRGVLTMTVANGPQAGRTYMHGFNLQNANPQAVEIAMRELSAICLVCGVPSLSGQGGFAQELMNKPLQGYISVQTRADTGGKTNELTDLRRADGTPLAQIVDAMKAGGGAPAGMGTAPSAPQAPQQPQAPQGQPPAGAGGWGQPQAGAPAQQPPQDPAAGGWGAPQGQPQQPQGQAPGGWGAPQQSAPAQQPQQQQPGGAPQGWGAPAAGPAQGQPPAGWGQ